MSDRPPHPNDISSAGDIKSPATPTSLNSDSDDSDDSESDYPDQPLGKTVALKSRPRPLAAAGPVLPNNVYPYRVDSFQHFGTIACQAQNAIGQSAPCLYHIMAAEIPDAVHNCTASNATATAVHVHCVAGRDGGIRQHFNVEVFEEHPNERRLYNTSFGRPAFVVRRLPSDAQLLLVVTAFNAQGWAAGAARVRVRTLAAPLMQTGGCFVGGCEAGAFGWDVWHAGCDAGGQVGAYVNMLCMRAICCVALRCALVVTGVINPRI